MPLTIVSADDTNGISFAEGTDITVLAGVTVSNTGTFASALTVTSTSYDEGQVTILGTLVAEATGINASGINGGSLNGNGDLNESTFYIGSTGQIFAGDVALQMEYGVIASSIINYGEIFGRNSAIEIAGASSGTGAFFIENHGSMSAFDRNTIDLGNNLTGSIVNTGLMTNTGGDNVVAIGTAGALDFTNSGTITTSGEFAILSSSAADIVNSGEIFGGILISGTNTDNIRNSGLIDGDVMLNAGDDTYVGIANGFITGELNLGVGDDTATLGDVGGLVRGSAGDDTITGGAGSDEIYGDNDDDLIRGRTGDDIIDGGSGNDTLRAGQGDDEIAGGTGDDFIRGGAGEDIISGGQGSDIIFGGRDADTFVFLSETDSPDDNALRDIIQDFTVGEDIIDLTAFGGLTYVGNAGFSNVAGQVYVTDANQIGRVKVFVDIDGDGVADMKIVLNNTTTLSEDDFLF